MRSPVLYGPWTSSADASAVNDYLQVFAPASQLELHRGIAQAVIGRPGWHVGWNPDDGMLEWVLDPDVDRDRCLVITAGATLNTVSVYLPDRICRPRENGEDCLSLEPADLPAWLDVQGESYRHGGGWFRSAPLRLLQEAVQSLPEVRDATEPTPLHQLIADAGHGVVVYRVANRLVAVTYGQRQLSAGQQWRGTELSLTIPGQETIVESCRALADVTTSGQALGSGVTGQSSVPGGVQQITRQPDPDLTGIATSLGSTQVDVVDLLR